MSDKFYESQALQAVVSELETKQKELGKKIGEHLDYSSEKYGKPMPSNQTLTELFLEQEQVSRTKETVSSMLSQVKAELN